MDLVPNQSWWSPQEQWTKVYPPLKFFSPSVPQVQGVLSPRVETRVEGGNLIVTLYLDSRAISEAVSTYGMAHWMGIQKPTSPMMKQMGQSSTRGPTPTKGEYNDAEQVKRHCAALKEIAKTSIYPKQQRLAKEALKDSGKPAGDLGIRYMVALEAVVKTCSSWEAIGIATEAISPGSKK